MYDKELYLAVNVFKATRVLKENFLEQAAYNIRISPKSCMSMCRNTIEIIAKEAYVKEGLKPSDNLCDLVGVDPNGKSSNAQKVFKDKKIIEDLNFVRKYGNAGAHNKDDWDVYENDCAIIFNVTVKIVCWFAAKYEDNPNLMDKVSEAYEAEIRSRYSNTSDRMESYKVSEKDLPGKKEEVDKTSETKVNGVDNQIHNEELVGGDYEQYESIFTAQEKDRNLRNHSLIEADYTNSTNVELLVPMTQVGSEWRIKRVAFPRIEKVQRVFVEPDNYATAKNQFDKKNVIVLSNENNVGKYSMAIHLLNNCQEIEEEFYPIYELQIPPKGRLSDLDNIRLKPNEGYIIDDCEDVLVPKTLDALSYQFKSLNAKLIIIQNKKASAYIDVRLKPYCFYCEKPKDFIGMVKKHIWINVDTEELYNNIVSTANDKVYELMNNNYRYPYECNAIAEKIAELQDFNQILEQDIYKSIFPNRIRQDIEVWFRDPNRTIDEVAGLFSLCIYREIELDSFYGIRNLIKDMLSNVIKFKNDAEERTESEAIGFIFGNNRDKMLEQIHATVSKININTVAGSIPYEYISFKTEQEGKYILSYILEQIPAVKEPLLEWIRENGVTTYPRMNRCLAATITELMQDNFSVVNEEIISPFAKSQNYYSHFLILNIIELLHLDNNDTFIMILWNYCKHWISVNSVGLNRLAIMLMGNYFFYKYPKKVLNSFKELFNRNLKSDLDSRIQVIIINDITGKLNNYIRYGRGDLVYIEHLIAWFAKWIKDEEELRLIPLSTFFKLLQYEHIDNTTKNYVYTILWAMEQDENIRRNVSYIFSMYLLNDPDKRKVAMDLMNEWFDSCATNDARSEFYIKWLKEMKPTLKQIVITKIESDLRKRIESRNSQHRRLALSLQKGWE